MKNKYVRYLPIVRCLEPKTSFAELARRELEDDCLVPVIRKPKIPYVKIEIRVVEIEPLHELERKPRKRKERVSV